MKAFLFSAEGRLNRSRYWLGILYLIGLDIVATVVMKVLSLFIGGDVTADGGFHATGLAAVPYLVISFGTLIVFVWASVCLGIKRYHDRGKSGLWILIAFVPFIGWVWNFIEAGCLRGTVGPNVYGPDPLSIMGDATPYNAAGFTR